VRDASGNTMATYQDKENDANLYLQEQNIFGSSRVGVVNRNLNLTVPVPATNIFTHTVGKKSLELSNHLGSVLTTVSDRKIPIDANSDNIVDFYLADVLSATDYYAGGMAMPGRSFNATNTRFGFCSYEKDDEVSGSGNAYDFEGYGYDPRLMRRKSPDPKSNKYPFISPYAYALNNPTSIKDPDGKDVYLIIWATADGQIGHAALAVSNYRAVQSQVNVNGMQVTQTTYVPDGTFTYYDLWPGGAGADETNATQNIPASYQKVTQVTWNGIFNADPSGGEGRNADGIIKLKTTYAEDQNVIQKLDARIAANQDYNGATNNCADNTECGIEAAIGKDIDADESITVTMNATTPNELYKAVEKLPNATVLRDAGSKVDNGFIQGAKGGFFGKVLNGILNIGNAPKAKPQG